MKPNNCSSFPNKTVYWTITVLYLLLLTITSAFLWTVDFRIPVMVILFYFMIVLMHGFVCSHADCPYTGKACPGAFGWFPVGILAAKFKRRKRDASPTKMIAILFILILLMQLGIIIIPAIKLASVGIQYSLGYTLLIVLHLFFFIRNICPRCAMSPQCPVGKFSKNLQSWKPF